MRARPMGRARRRVAGCSRNRERVRVVEAWNGRFERVPTRSSCPAARRGGGSGVLLRRSAAGHYCRGTGNGAAQDERAPVDTSGKVGCFHAWKNGVILVEMLSRHGALVLVKELTAEGGNAFKRENRALVVPTPASAGRRQVLTWRGFEFPPALGLRVNYGVPDDLPNDGGKKRRRRQAGSRGRTASPPRRRSSSCSTRQGRTRRGPR